MHRCRAGFTLVELSIVLVVLGLLVGGVFVGQSLVKSAGLQRTAKWELNFKSEFDAFTDKYSAYPGDMSAATTAWGVSNVAAMNCSTQPGTASATGTCNGDGNGYIAFSATMPAESALVIHHLELAGMDTTKLAGGAAFPGTPTSFLQTPGLVDTALSYVGGTSPYADNYQAAAPGGNAVSGIGLQTGALCSGAANGAALTPADALYIDTKLDDGLPNSGIFYGANGVGTDCSTAQSCLSASGSSYIYNASNTNLACRVMFLLVQK